MTTNFLRLVGAATMAAVVWAPTPVAVAADFKFGTRAAVSCTVAVQYRDTALYASLAQALDNFDATREARIKAALDAFEADGDRLAKDYDKADAAAKRVIYVALTGIAIGKAADRVAKIGVKPTLTNAEKQAMDALSGRSAQWTQTFIKYGALQEVDLKDLAVMPVSFLMAFTPYAWANVVWDLGTTANDVVFALADREIARNETKLTGAIIKARAQELIKKMQTPKIAEINRLKNAIDAQCGKSKQS